MSIKDNGLMIRQKEKVYIFIKMVLHIQDNGIMINNMVMDIKNGQMEQNIKVIIYKV